MQFRNQAILLLVASLSSTTSAFVGVPARSFGLVGSSYSGSSLFSSEADATEVVAEPAVVVEAVEPAVAVEEPAAPVVPAAPVEERFTIYASNIPFEVDDKDLKAFFEECGTVKDLSVPRRKETNDSRGFAFVDMASMEEVEKAVAALNGKDFGGRAMNARVSLPKEQLPKGEGAKPPRRNRGPDGPKIYIGNLPYGIDEAELTKFIAEHGEVANVYLARDDDGKDRGFGFVTMASEEAVEAAIAGVDGSFFQGRRLAARRPLPEGSRSEKKTNEANVERIYFGNLSFDTKIETMKTLFAEHGSVLNLFINEDFTTHQSRGYGFCQMSKEEAGPAIAALNGMEVDGRTIRVTVSEDKVDKLKIYCGSLSFDTTEDTVREVFEAYGQVFSIYLPEDKQYGGSRGFAIITMAKEGGDKAILELDEREVDGRNIRVNEAKPKGAPTTETKKIYVGNLDFDTTEDTIMEAFAEYGEVKDCILPEDRDFGGSRGFGFVVMDADVAKAAIDELDGIELDGRVIRVVEADGGNKRGGRPGSDDGELSESSDDE
eukprot:CAMPEP_0119008136 /NCGR_PEP_ID=MMETSP1176-20130426/3483_1 /TAXON_ID=265551 /ORGANISM="Synedropsis recta cf, Strain CCMP1620" /LENGTH=545 /DNA_ID=CAMNT_0006960409 /DNA_START=32 /DNA_END=1666 /DNA_ORIENTATION=+